MTRIVTTTYRYKRPPRKQQTVPLTGLTKRVRVSVGEKPTVAAITAPPPANDDGKPAPLPAVEKKKSAIVTAASRKRRIGDGPPLPMELPLSRRPAERKGDTYKRMKTAMAQRLRGETN